MLNNKKVIALAKTRGISKTEFAGKLGVSIATVDAWEHNEKSIYPSLEGAICKVLDCTISDISDEAAPAADVMPAPTEPEPVKKDEIFEKAAETPAEVLEKTKTAVETEKTIKKAEAKKPAKKAESKKPEAASRNKAVAPLLYEAIKETKFNTKDVKKNDLDSMVEWFGAYAKELKAQTNKGIDLLLSAVRAANLERKLDKVNLTPQALDVAARFDKLTDASKAALLTILAGLK